jgi:PAS domain S-box-containing protein
LDNRAGKTYLLRYGVAVCSVAAGLVVRLVLGEVLGSSVPYITLYPAVMFAALYGGIGPGMLATLLSLGAVLYFLLPRFHPLSIEADAVRAVLFVVFCALFCVFNEAVRRARGRSERDRDLLQVTLASIGDAVISTDAQGRVTFINPVAQGLTGWSQEDAAGKAISEVFVVKNEFTGLAAEIPVEKVIREGVVVNLANHTVLRGKDGRETPIEDSAAPIYGEGGRVLGVVLVFRDVTDRRISEEAVKRSEERLKLALDAGQIGVWDWDIVRDRIEWSAQVYEIFGVERSDLGGGMNHFTQLVYPEDREQVDEAVRASLQDGVPYAVEFRAVHPSKGVRWISTTGQVHRNVQGVPVRMLGSVMDSTERKQGEAQVRQQWHTFDTALSNTPDFNYVLDLEGRFTYANRARLLIFQKTREEVLGKNFHELDYPPELAERFLREIRQVIETKEPFRGESPMTWKSGLTRQYEYIFVPVLSAEGRVEAVVGTTHDITDWKYAQADLKRSNDELTRVNRELEEFAYVASHDLQEPLRMVNIYTQLILEDIGQQGTDINAYAAFVRQGVRRMEGLIQDLLTFSRAVHSELVTIGVADLSDALSEALSVLKNRIEESGCVITADPLPKVRADVAQMAHVFQNLLSNALKYCKYGSVPAIHISARRDGNYWVVSIEDHGIGFEPRYAERIFGLFKRLYKEEYPGTGLGLAICKRIVERYGGRIWAEGRPGEGATFYFSLPRGD